MSILLHATSMDFASVGHYLLNPLDLLTKTWLKSLILPTLFVIVFIETGLLFPFLPGDSLLFAVGILASMGTVNIFLAIIVAIIAAFLGDQNAYWIGRKVGFKLFNRPDSRWFKHDFLEKSEQFYEKNGPKAVILARFVPIVRTFSAVVAGIGKMRYPMFALFDVVGAIVWCCVVIMLGYWLGNIPFVQKYIEEILVILIVITMLPAGIKYLKQRKSS